jgi:hypothetical protein
MKPRTVYEKAVQDFTETARRLARLNQHFRQASFAEFEMLMVDDGVLKRYGLPELMVKRALIEVYEAVVLGWDHSWWLPAFVFEVVVAAHVGGLGPL